MQLGRTEFPFYQNIKITFLLLIKRCKLIECNQIVIFLLENYQLIHENLYWFRVFYNSKICDIILPQNWITKLIDNPSIGWGIIIKYYRQSYLQSEVVQNFCWIACQNPLSTMLPYDASFIIAPSFDGMSSLHHETLFTSFEAAAVTSYEALG